MGDTCGTCERYGQIREIRAEDTVKMGENGRYVRYVRKIRGRYGKNGRYVRYVRKIRSDTGDTCDTCGRYGQIRERAEDTVKMGAVRAEDTRKIR